MAADLAMRSMRLIRDSLARLRSRWAVRPPARVRYRWPAIDPNRAVVSLPDGVEGDGWRLVRPNRDLVDGWVDIDPLVPDADWFWGSLQRKCVPSCCGLEAYDFSAESVAWACGWGTSRPSGNDWRDDNPGDPVQLAGSLRAAAHAIRRHEPDAVNCSLFDEVLLPEFYARLFEDLAAKAEPKW